MIEQRARYRRLRDGSIFVGDPDDIVPDTFGAGLPEIRQWTEENFEFAGYVTGFDPAELADREALRDELGYGPDEQVCVVTVGGSGVGGDLLRRVIDAAHRRPGGSSTTCASSWSPARASTPPSLPRRKGVSYRRFVPDLYRHLAACDLAVVQGGLTTCMELTANRRPFVYVPAAPPLRAELPRPPPAAALRRRSSPRLRGGGRPRRSRQGDRRRDRSHGRLPPRRDRWCRPRRRRRSRELL